MSIYTDLIEPLEQKGFRISLSDDQCTMLITDKDNLATGELTLDGDVLHLRLKTVHEPFTRSASMYNINNKYEVTDSILGTFDGLLQLLDPHEMLRRVLDNNHVIGDFLTSTQVKYTLDTVEIWQDEKGQDRLQSIKGIKGMISYDPKDSKIDYTINIPKYKNHTYTMHISPDKDSFTKKLEAGIGMLKQLALESVTITS